MRPHFASSLEFISHRNFVVSTLFERERETISNRKRSISAADRLTPKQARSRGRPFDQHWLFLIMAIIERSAKRRPIGALFTVGLSAGVWPNRSFVTAVFERRKIRSRFVIRQRRNITAAPLDLQAGETDQQKND